MSDSLKPDPAAGQPPAAVSVMHSWVSMLIDGEGPGILRMLWRLLRNEQDVMDVYQDCFCKLAARGSNAGLANVKAYAYRTAANMAVEVIRTRARRRSHWPRIVADRPQAANDTDAPDSTSPAEESDAREHLSAKLRAGIATLPEHLRQVIILRDLSQLPYKEVGKALGIDPATARVYRRHAVVKLAEFLDAGADE